MKCPPATDGKSELVSIRFPAWYLGRNPTKKVISASYSEMLATEVGRKARNILDTQGCFGVQLSADSKAKNLWHTDGDPPGQFLSVGIGSGVVGFGGDLILIDDPHKRREEAESETMRDHIKNWYSSEILTRQEPGAAIGMVLHRWHEDDLSGWVQAQEPGRWTIVHLPALAEEDDVLGREEGEPLWKERYAESDLRKMCANDRDWQSLFQQRPVPDEGEIFKWFPTYSELPQLRSIGIAVDTAYTDTASADYTAWAAWGFDGSRVYLIEADRYRGESPDAIKHITAFVYRLRQQYPKTSVKVLHRQAVAIDRIAAQHIRRGVPTVGVGGKTGRAGLPVVTVKLPRGNTKKELATIVSDEFEGGTALVPERANWPLDEWLHEHKMFPAGKHDDWVETTVIALWHFFRKTPFVRPSAPIHLWPRFKR